MTHELVTVDKLADLKANQFTARGKSHYFAAEDGTIHRLRDPGQMDYQALAALVRELQDTMFVGPEYLEPDGACTGADFFDSAFALIRDAGLAPVVVRPEAASGEPQEAHASDI